MMLPKRATHVLLLTLGAMLPGTGCSQQPVPPPALPALTSPLPEPPEEKPAKVDDVELILTSEEGEPIEAIDPSTPFRAKLRFRLIEPPSESTSQADVQLIVYGRNGDAITCSESVGTLTADGAGHYRFEAELKSSPYGSREHFVRVRLLPDKNFIVEIPLLVR